MATLTSFIARVRSVLIDSPALIWTEEVVTESIRLALGEYNLVMSSQAVPGTAITLEGLDGAAASNIPAKHESLIVWGAAAYSALARAVDRAESFQPGAVASDLKSWGDTRLREFKSMLALAVQAARLAELRHAESAPWGSWE